MSGATGGLGRAIVREALAQGHAVRATGRSREAGAQLARDGAQFMAADLVRDDPVPLLAGIDSVIHAAALSSSWGRDADFIAANVTATQRLLDAAGQADVRRFVFISSPSIFADFADRERIGADALPAAHPLNAYARTKLEAERLVLARSSAALACCALRPRALVGPGDRVILPRLAALAARRRMPLPRGGRAIIELTDLRDAARAVIATEDRALALGGMAINLSGGQPIAVRTLAMRLAQALGTTPRLIDMPLAAARPLARLAEAVARIRGSTDEPVLTRYTLATLAFSQTFDPEPARRLIGFVPQFDAVETLLAEARKLAGAAT
ncbi:NAD(P)-dependent oxidoreductase [Novosphingobium sp.]|uniref:NAD-dependent epimerase/dehydratase family protein n=1 Tax=Novosphingobium sp. TaxID=1874826 RepID=UPI0025D07221|nr:NAD-dependent epimerase/dehydratase family protein [Novosphingobium sp.]